MIWRSLPLYSVKVVSASLIESMPLLGKGRITTGSYATLTFHLRRFYKSESFGFDCTFQPFGGSGVECFVSGMRADLVASSAALRGVLDGRQTAHKSAVRVTSINGVARLTEAAVRELLDSGRDVVVQCDVSAVTPSGSDRGQADAAARGKKNEAERVRTSGRRERKPKAAATDALDGDDTEIAEEGIGKVVRTRRRRGRERPRKALKAGKKRLRYAGARSVVEMTHEDADFSSVDGGSLTDVETPGPVTAAAAEDINAAALATLNELAPVKPVRTRGRRSTKLEKMRGVKHQSTALAKAPGDVWFTQAKKTAVDGREDVEVPAADTARTARKRRSRPPKMAMTDAPAAVNAVKAAEGDRGRSTARVFKAEQQKKVAGRRGRPRKTDKPVEELGNPQVTEASARAVPAGQDEDVDGELEF
ncbi:hypothetical protein JIQ42_02673 [Leishmania sp. Namibia]|uniref:hypothetical protein n=1 Tax=Leishmania sp. Namibia TaxID=2802991 RepID=UPI001B41D023|nr:hypothetical protein JIQ42_02673 [Leishmania sp. Namibia]